MLEDVKLALRIDGSDLNAEINDLIAAARSDLVLSGVDPEKANADDDPLIKRAVIVYARTHYDWDSREGERLQRSYDLLKSHLSMASDYRAGDPNAGA